MFVHPFCGVGLCMIHYLLVCVCIGLCVVNWVACSMYYGDLLMLNELVYHILGASF